MVAARTRAATRRWAPTQNLPGGRWLRKAPGVGSDDARGGTPRPVRGSCSAHHSALLARLGRWCVPEAVSALRSSQPSRHRWKRPSASSVPSTCSRSKPRDICRRRRRQPPRSTANHAPAAPANAGGGCDQLSADEILLFVFALVRARVPCRTPRRAVGRLPAEELRARAVRLLADDLQAALHLLETSWERSSMPTAPGRPEKKKKRKYRSASRLSPRRDARRTVRLPDGRHARLPPQTNGRLLRRGDHIVRLGASRSPPILRRHRPGGASPRAAAANSLGDQRAKLLRKVRVGICAIRAFARATQSSSPTTAAARSPPWTCNSNAHAELGVAATTPSIYGRSSGPTARRAPPTPQPSSGIASARCRRHAKGPRIDGETSTQLRARKQRRRASSVDGRWCRRRRRAYRRRRRMRRSRGRWRRARRRRGGRSERASEAGDRRGFSSTGYAAATLATSAAQSVLNSSRSPLACARVRGGGRRRAPRPPPPRLPARRRLQLWDQRRCLPGAAISRAGRDLGERRRSLKIGRRRT